MGQRYTPSFDENADVICPDFYLDGMGDFGGELNGGVDRDNLPQSTIARTECDTSLGRVFNQTGASFNTDTNFSPTMTITEWQGGILGAPAGSASLGLFTSTWTALQDAHYDIHASLTWFWDGSYIGGSVVSTGSRPDTVTTFDTLMLRITVDGIEIAVGGPWDDGDVYWSTYLLGSIQLPAGVHTLKVECMVVRRECQTGLTSGKCINTVVFNSRALVVLERDR